MIILKKEKRFSKKVYSDEASAFISCPEYVAKHIANQAASMGKFSKAVEMCSCIGAMCIQLSKFMDEVVGIELDSKRVSMARKNAEIYGVDKKVKFIKGSVLDPDLLNRLSADIVFLDPGWSTRKMDRSSHVSSIDDTKPSLRQMVTLARKYLTHKIVTRVPATFSVSELNQLGFFRIENIFINDELVFKVAYYIEKLDKTYEEDVKFE